MAKILVIDDARFSRSRVSAMVKDMGYDILEAEDGRQGLNMAFEHKPDCILSDLLMPVLDGITLLTTLRDENIGIPVIILSANVQESTKEQCMSLNAVAFIKKPPKKSELQVLLEKIINPEK